MGENENMYQNGKIYKIIDSGYNACYYGSTVQSLSKRLSTHKKDYGKYCEGKKRFSTIFSMFDEYEPDNCKIELVELFPCNSKMELHKKEGEYIRNNECVNKYIPGRSAEERKADNLERFLEQARERTRKYRENLTDEKKQLIKQKEKEYRDTHKEKIRETSLRKLTCPVCGIDVCAASKARHEQTDKHIINEKNYQTYKK